MGIFNQHSDNHLPKQQGFLRGMQGSPGVGFSLTKDGNYDILNKKLKMLVKVLKVVMQSQNINWKYQ